MGIRKIKVDRDLCIGAAPCVFAADGVFELDDENKAVLKLKNGEKTSALTERTALESDTVPDDVLMEAAQSCPVKAIMLYDDDDNKVYP